MGARRLVILVALTLPMTITVDIGSRLGLGAACQCFGPNYGRGGRVAGLVNSWQYLSEVFSMLHTGIV